MISQTLCKVEVFPAFALPIIRTRNLMFGLFISFRQGRQGKVAGYESDEREIGGGRAV